MRVILIITFFILSGIVACSKYNYDDCEPSSNCYPYPIDSGYVYVNLTYNGNGPGVPVILYEGYVEDQNILWADTVYQDELIFWLPIKTRYAVEAFYSYGGQTTIALDGKKLKEESYDDCGETCYEESSIILDVKKI